MMVFKNFSNILSKNSFGSRFPWFGGIMVVFSDMMFIGFCPPRWLPVERLISCWFTSVLISSEGVDGILISTPMPSVTAMLFEVLITCNLGKVTRAPGRDRLRVTLHEKSF